MSHPGECEIDEFCGLCIKDNEKVLSDEVSRLKAQVDTMVEVVEAAKAWKAKEPWPYLNAVRLATALDNLGKEPQKQKDCECGGLSLDPSGKTHKSWCNDRKRE
jgi:hypothetical protein